MLYHQVRCCNLLSFVVMMLLPQVFYLILADVFAIVFVTDVIATTYCNVDLLADVIASGDVPLIVASGQLLCPVADVIATCWLILFGRCYSQVAGVVATVNVSSCLADWPLRPIISSFQKLQ